MGLKRKAREMRERREKHAAAAEALYAKYPSVPECPSDLQERRKKLKQRNPKKLLIARPKWEDSKPWSQSCFIVELSRPLESQWFNIVAWPKIRKKNTNQ